MNKVEFLGCLKEFTEETVKDLIFPLKPQRGDMEQEFRTANVHLMRLPDGHSATKFAPYVLHTVLTGEDEQPPGQRVASSVTVRTIFCVYFENEEEGGLALLNLMERVRIGFLKYPVLAKQYRLDLSKKLETLVYPDDTAPYYAGEMISVWQLPTVREEMLKSEWEKR